MPTPVKVTVLPETVHTLLALVVAKTTGLPDAPPVALSVAGNAPNTTGDVGLKPVMAWLAKGVTALLGRDAVPVPAALVAVTVKV